MGTALKTESSAVSCMAVGDDDLTAATDATVALSSAHSSQQVEGPAPVLLYPINVNSALLVNRDSKTSHGSRSNEAVSTSSEFTHGAIVHLIRAMQRCWGIYSARERSLLFQNVQKELECHGHTLPVEKIRRKWNNLIVTYRRVKDRSFLFGGQAKTSWEYFEMMDSILGKNKCVQSNEVSPTLFGFATTAKATVRPVDQSSTSAAVTAMAAPCLLSTGIITNASQIPTLVTSPVLCKVTPKLNPRPSCGTDTAMASISPQNSPPLVNRRPLKQRLRQLRLNSLSSRVARQHIQAEDCDLLLQNFLTSQEERGRLDEQRQRKTDARDRRREKTANTMADAMGRMATALELISSKQDTIIALLQRLADKY